MALRDMARTHSRRSSGPSAAPSSSGHTRCGPCGEGPSRVAPRQVSLAAGERATRPLETKINQQPPSPPKIMARNIGTGNKARTGRPVLLRDPPLAPDARDPLAAPPGRRPARGAPPRGFRRGRFAYSATKAADLYVRFSILLRPKETERKTTKVFTYSVHEEGHDTKL